MSHVHTSLRAKNHESKLSPPQYPGSAPDLPSYLNNVKHFFGHPTVTMGYRPSLYKNYGCLTFRGVIVVLPALSQLTFCGSNY